MSGTQPCVTKKPLDLQQSNSPIFIGDSRKEVSAGNGSEVGMIPQPGVDTRGILISVLEISELRTFVEDLGSIPSVNVDPLTRKTCQRASL